jgi:CheY-like chemotaxis protein
VLAADGIEGLDQLHHPHPDLVFGDLAMPRMDGIEFGLRMRGDMRFRCVPLIESIRCTRSEFESARLRLANVAAE